MEAVAGLLLSVPALIGAFIGAPVIGREMETGTFRYTWTQEFGRCRWALAKLVPLAVAVTTAAGRAVRAAHRRDRLAGPAARGLMRPASTAPGDGG
ncbi:MAG TPA: hypothetical protein VHZ03_41525 [Trebonia sp.]|nr:hypothetical protein [Trebonia sp.]